MRSLSCPTPTSRPLAASIVLALALSSAALVCNRVWAERTSRGSYWGLSNVAQVPQCSDWVGQTGSVTNPGITAPTVEFVGGVEQRPIVVVEYDPEWADTFERERERIRVALGSRLVSVQHVGCTAVAGLAAKPIIDVLVTVANVDDEPSYLPALLS